MDWLTPEVVQALIALIAGLVGHGTGRSAAAGKISRDPSNTYIHPRHRG